MNLALGGLLLSMAASGGCKDLPFKEKKVNFQERVAEAKRLPNNQHIRFALAAMITPQETNRDYVRLVSLLNNITNQQAVLIHGSTYSQVNQMLAAGKLEYAFLCTGGYTHPSQEGAGVTILAVPVVDGKMTYRSRVIVRESTLYGSFSDLKGTRFSFTDPLSLTGYLYPSSQVRALGQDKDTFFKAYSFVGSHDRAITSVRTGASDAAAVDSLVFDFIKARQPERVKGLRVLQTSVPFGMPPLVAAPHVTLDDREQWKDALLSLHRSAEGKAVLGRLSIDRFEVPATDLYDPVRELWKNAR